MNKLTLLLWIFMSNTWSVVHSFSGPASSITSTSRKSYTINSNSRDAQRCLTTPWYECQQQLRQTPNRISESVLYSVSPSSSEKTEMEQTFDKLLDDLKMRYQIFQKSLEDKVGFKQTVANVLAGEYDEVAVKKDIETILAAHSLCMFTWEKSPSCVKAVKALELMGIYDQCHNERLDDPWSKGNPMRAELGKMVGRTSVPFVFVNGTYIGGYDGGIDPVTAPGMVDMAFKGTLKPTLEEAGIKFK